MTRSGWRGISKGIEGLHWHVDAVVRRVVVEHGCPGSRLTRIVERDTWAEEERWTVNSWPTDFVKLRSRAARDRAGKYDVHGGGECVIYFRCSAI